MSAKRVGFRLPPVGKAHENNPYARLGGAERERGSQDAASDDEEIDVAHADTLWT